MRNRIAGAASIPHPIRQELLLAAVLFLLCFAIFWKSPHRHIGDNQYAMLLSEELLDHGSFALERYFAGQAWLDPRLPWYHAPWQLERHGGHVYYVYPPGSSVLSVPFAAFCRVLGRSSIRPDGLYDVEAEVRMQAFAAACLMALLAVVVYAQARLLLPRRHGLWIAAGTALGSSIWSTASRGLWSHTWECLLLGLLLLALLGHEARGWRLRPALLGLLCGVLYTVRPTGSVAIALTGLYVLSREPRLALRYAYGLAAPLLAFFTWSWIHFQTWMPHYYRYGAVLDPRAIPEGLAGTLLSPSRGLLIFTPAVVWVVALLIRHCKRLPCPRLALLASAAIGLQQLVLSAWPTWWGGQAYGARLSAGHLPYLAVLAVLALRAELDRRQEAPGKPWRAKLVDSLGILLLVAGVLMNAPGALKPEVQSWNHTPLSVDRWPEKRLWDWRRPQPLAAFGWPLPFDYRSFPEGGRLPLWDATSEPYLWGGWDEPEGPRRVTTWPTAAFLFRWTAGRPALLRINAEALPGRGGELRQPVSILLNGNRLPNEWVVQGQIPRIYRVVLPAKWMAERNTVTFVIPEAGITLRKPRLQTEFRGLGVRWLELTPIQRSDRDG